MSIVDGALSIIYAGKFARIVLCAPQWWTTYEVAGLIDSVAALLHQMTYTGSFVFLGFVHLASHVGDVCSSFQVISRYNAEVRWDDDTLRL